MESDDRYGYSPDPSTFKCATHTRIIPIEELHPNDQTQIRAAIAENKRLRTGEKVDDVVAANWYCASHQLLRDIMDGAQKSADNTYQPQLIHMHPADEPCEDFDHIDVVPHPARSRAVGGPQRARREAS
jgi:hypothetical protein